MTDGKAKNQDAILRPAKENVESMVVRMVPEYVELLCHFQNKGGWIRLPEKQESLVKRLNISNYVLLYEDEKRIHAALGLGLFGEQGFQEWATELNAASNDEQQRVLDDLASSGLNDTDWQWLDDFFPDTPEKEEAQRQLFESLSEQEKQQAVRQAQFFWSFFFSNFYNVLSVMIHGQKLTYLVPQAMAGDDEALCKALQIDRRLLYHHPYFQERHLNALNEGNGDLLAKIGYRLANPGCRGKIRYPGLYMVFSTLETLDWLDDFAHGEILDLCDAAKLDRYQNRIEDVNYLTKRLHEYRRMQKTSGLSMH